VQIGCSPRLGVRSRQAAGGAPILRHRSQPVESQVTGSRQRDAGDGRYAAGADLCPCCLGHASNPGLRSSSRLSRPSRGISRAGGPGVSGPVAGL